MADDLCGTIGLSHVANPIIGWFLAQYDERDDTGAPRARVLGEMANDLRLSLDARVVEGLVAAAEEFMEWASRYDSKAVVVQGPTVARSALPHGRPGCPWGTAGDHGCSLPAGHDGEHDWLEP